MLIDNIGWAMLFYFLQPVFLAGLGYAWFNRTKRVGYSRKQFRVNFNRTNFEVRDFLLKGIVPGMLVSVLALVLGVPLTVEWYFLYQGVAILLLLAGGSRLVHPLFSFSITSILLYLFNRFSFELNWAALPFLGNKKLYDTNFELTSVSSLNTNLLFLTSLVLLVTAWVLNSNEDNKVFPRLGSSRRGKAIAQYPNTTLWVLPLAVIVPGKVIEPFAAWWPIFNIGGERFALLLLPVLVGLHYTVSTQLLGAATDHIQKEFFNLSLFGFLGTALAYFFPPASFWVTGGLLLFGLLILYRHRKREALWNFRYGPADEGLRVIAVRPDSPAERLNLAIGDIIVYMNDEKMTSREAFNETLAYNRSYIKMRVKRQDGEIVLAETPLFDNDYNNLGVLVLENEIHTS